MVWAVVEYCAFVFEWRMLVFVWELVAQWFSQHEQLTVLALAWAGVEQRLSVYEQKKAVALGEVEVEHYVGGEWLQLSVCFSFQEI